MSNPFLAPNPQAQAKPGLKKSTVEALAKFISHAIKEAVLPLKEKVDAQAKKIEALEVDAKVNEKLLSKTLGHQPPAEPDILASRRSNGAYLSKDMSPPMFHSVRGGKQ